ncbi:MAG: hypothetical protein WCI73_16615 [Phycisphaerae bacterium]
MLKTTVFLLLHLVPLLLASTAFTLVTAPLGLAPFNWNYFAYTHADGWGYVYRSDYTLAQVLTYLLAYGAGLVLYPLLTRPHFLGVLAALICLAGSISFTIELSHWLFDHHLCLIGSFPILLLPIAMWTIIRRVMHKFRPVAVQQSAS